MGQYSLTSRTMKNIQKNLCVIEKEALIVNRCWDCVSLRILGWFYFFCLYYLEVWLPSSEWLAIV